MKFTERLRELLAGKHHYDSTGYCWTHNRPCRKDLAQVAVNALPTIIEVLEAAEVFGATLWQRLRYIILPLLRPSLQVALILRTILAFQVFAVVIVMSGGDIMTVLANETYRQYYDLRNFNVAAAYASFILLLSMITAFFYLRAVRTQEEVAE